MQLVTSVPQE